MSPDLLPQLRAALAGQVPAERFTLMEPLFGELWSLREQQPARAVRFTSAEPVGARLHESGQPASQAVSQVLAGGRALVELAEAAGTLDAAGVRLLGALVDEAAVQVAASVEKERRARRQQWLSFLSHELKNPLNTILNALWLLRERGSNHPSAARFVELAERAVRRLETRIGDVRALDEQLRASPPGWEALHAHTPSTDPTT